MNKQGLTILFCLLGVFLIYLGFNKNLGKSINAYQQVKAKSR